MAIDPIEGMQSQRAEPSGFPRLSDDGRSAQVRLFQPMSPGRILAAGIASEFFIPRVQVDLWKDLHHNCGEAGAILVEMTVGLYFEPVQAERSERNVDESQEQNCSSQEFYHGRVLRCAREENESLMRSDHCGEKENKSQLQIELIPVCVHSLGGRTAAGRSFLLISFSPDDIFNRGHPFSNGSMLHRLLDCSSGVGGQLNNVRRYIWQQQDQMTWGDCS